MIFLLLSLIACERKTTPEAHAEHGDEKGAHAEEGAHEEGAHGNENGAHAEEGGHAEHGDEVSLSPEALANARIKVEEMVNGPLEGVVVAPARVTLDPRREARVGAVTSGQIERILVRPGDRVKSGTALATVLSADLGDAIGAHLSASARLEAARAKRDRISGLQTDGVSSKSQLLEAESDLTVAAAEAEAAEERLRVFGVTPSTVRPEKGEHFSPRFSVRSPVEGEILGIDATLGKAVEGGDPLFHVGNLDEVWVIVDVSEKNLSAVRVGASVSFTVDAYGPEVFTGTVDQVGGWLDPGSRTAEVRIVVPNPDHRLKPNMFASARLSLANETISGFAIPADAVQTVEGRPSVFVEEVPGTYLVRQVRAEPMADGRLHVLDGLAPGDRVVVEGAFTLRSEFAKGELGGGHAH